ncbi:twin-arginine translocase subunit TatC [Sphingosinicella rhizophila]|uniref:Sec-independent protein translocase protein TatC n=1 Tax=Sphingosinicella rhizophila TaxID=3050082 RepID=A0ABU3Q3S2_9SPHN|nr:twin-arginine translocase subunit TatC [Sphingosinicella sp. GR2756]MDT9598059.1 twin-arginine translocase subunit TatC [Sphingosinicella sp. GR2756]
MSDIDESRAPLMDHLIELRRRLIWSFLALGAAFAVCFYFAEYIFAFLAQPLVEAFGAGQGKLIYTKLYEAFFVEIRVALFAAFFMAFPIIASQLWAFVAPGLYAKEKRAFLPFIIATPVLFLMGGALAYYLVMPTAFRFFLQYEGNLGGIEQEALPAVGDYLSLVMHFILAFGVAFLLPILLMLMERAGLVTRQQLKGGRRYAILIAFVIAAVATPPDVVSQFMLAIPLILLFELSLIAIWFTERRRARTAASETP